MAYNKYKDLANRTKSDIALKNKAYKIATNPKYDGFQRALASMVWKCSKKERSKKVLGSGIENKIYKHMATVGKSVYFNVLDDIVKKYNNTWHSSIKMKPKDVKDDFLLSIVKNLIKKILSLKQVIMLRFQSIKIFLLRAIRLIGVKKSLLLKI